MKAWILVGKTPIATTVDEWAKWIDAGSHVIIASAIPGTDIRVSTVFLGIDHSFAGWGSPDHVPTLFETMVFGGEEDGQRIVGGATTKPS